MGMFSVHSGSPTLPPAIGDICRFEFSPDSGPLNSAAACPRITHGAQTSLVLFILHYPSHYAQMSLQLMMPWRTCSTVAHSVQVI